MNPIEALNQRRVLLIPICALGALLLVIVLIASIVQTIAHRKSVARGDRDVSDPTEPPSSRPTDS